MRILSRKVLQVTAMMAVVVFPSAAAADTITITGGTMETQIRASLARGLFEGSGFLLGFGADGFAATVATDCVPCVAGDSVNFSAEFNLPRASGRALVDGMSYSQIFLEMTGTFSAPSFQISGSETVIRSSPFTYAGTIAGFLIDPWEHGPTTPAFTKSLTGRGTASATFIFFDGGDEGRPSFTADDLRYDFEDPAAVPEPATLLLCGAGMAVMGVRRRLRQSRRL